MKRKSRDQKPLYRRSHMIVLSVSSRGAKPLSVTLSIAKNTVLLLWLLHLLGRVINHREVMHVTPGCNPGQYGVFVHVTPNCAN